MWKGKLLIEWKSIFSTIVVFVLVLMCSVVVLQGTGVLEAGNLTHSGSENNWLRILPLSLLIGYSLKYKNFYRFCVFPIVVLLAVYFPIGFNFGLPNAGQIVSALNTDILEVQEFFSLIPIWQFVVPLLVGVALGVSHWLVLNFKIKFFTAPFYILIMLAAIVYFAGDMRFFTQGARYAKEVIVGLVQMREMKNVESAWKVTSVNPKYKNYVLVIGESNRRDYMHAYGYSVDNTPFMESKGWLLDGFTAVADYTIPSLQKDLTLTKKEEAVNYSTNVIDLANLSGFETYWFSNQGHIDKKNTPITMLADRALHKTWIKSGNRSVENTSDLELLPLMINVLSKKVQKNRFFVLHLMGSHSSVCERIHAPFSVPIPNRLELQDAYCYEVSMRQTDNFLEKLDEILKETGETYSMIYFSDHGVSHNTVQGKFVMNHAYPANHHRDIPLYRVSSDDVQLNRITARRFANNLTEGVSAWLGVTTEQLPKPRDLFRTESDPDDYGILPMLAKRRNDPPIDVR